MKIDLHVHSRFSTRPSQWVLQKLGCHECYTKPEELDAIAKKRGLDWVTITDHNNINGCLEIAHLPNTFISEEVTSYFPEDGWQGPRPGVNINQGKTPGSAKTPGKYLFHGELSPAGEYYPYPGASALVGKRPPGH